MSAAPREPLPSPEHATDARRIAPSDLPPGQLLALRNLLFMISRGNAHPAAELACELVRESPEALAWLRQHADEVDVELHRQLDILDASELDFYGGHIAWTDHDDMAPDKGWQAFCRCGWETSGFPDEAAAEAAGNAHLARERQS